MTRWRLIWKREVLRALFQPSFYITLAVFSAMNILNFWKQVQENTGEFVGLNVLLFGSLFFWVLILLWATVLTLRTFPDEFRHRTMELWLSAPLREGELVVGKFFAAWTLYIIGTLPLLMNPPLLRWSEGASWTIPWAEIMTGLVGVWAIGGFLLAVGMGVGLIFEMPTPAFLGVFSVLLGIFFADSFIPVRWVEPPRWWYGLMLLQQAGDFARGVMDSRALIAVGTGIVFFLFLSVRLLQLKRLR